MNDALRRVIRTFFQFAVAGGLTTIINELTGLSANEKVLVQGLNMLIVTYGQNLLEDNGIVRAVLKAPASDGVDPFPDNETTGSAQDVKVKKVKPKKK